MRSEWKASLEKAAGSVRREIDVGWVIHRSQQLRARRWVIVIMLGLAGAASTGLVVESLSTNAGDVRSGGVAGAPNKKDDAPNGNQVSSSPGDETTPTKCEFAPVRPSYLPWLKEGQEAPAPSRTYDAEIGMAVEYWQNPNNSSEEVDLTRRTEADTEGPGEPVQVEIDGVDGEFKLSEGNRVHITWNLESTSCNLIVLAYSFSQGLTVDEAEREIRKVAESLS